jgi:hypothetical protein
LIVSFFMKDSKYDGLVGLLGLGLIFLSMVLRLFWTEEKVEKSK